VKGDFHARFRENAGVQFPCVTRLAVTESLKTHQMNRTVSQIILIFLAMLSMATQCDKYAGLEVPNHFFIEKVKLSPQRKIYSVNDTIWLDFTTSSKTLFDSITNQRLSSSAIMFQFGVGVLAKYEYQATSSGFCEFLAQPGVIPSTRTFSEATVTSFEVGCDNASSYNVRLGIVIKVKGYYVLDMSTATQTQPCPGQTDPYSSSYLRFTFDVSDSNKDIYFEIPETVRKEYPTDLTLRQIESKAVFAFKVL
jgi:hypothetical protein